MQVEELESAEATRDYYEGRYARGYMDRWEQERAERIRDVLRPIRLPAGARILDFGSGSGALTRVLLEHWPDATVVGADISRAAVHNAAQREAERGGTHRIRFAVLDADFVRANEGAFDLVFSHHVLEHVFDLPSTIRDLASMLRPDGRMLHVLPCGNHGSLPHWLAERQPDGIDTAAGNRFYFEEASHLRRLQSDELTAHFAAHDIAPVHAAFGYHGIGALRLFTEMTPRDLFAILNPLRCHRRYLLHFLALLLGCLTLAAARAPVQLLVRSRRLLHQVFRFRTRSLSEPGSICLLLLALPALCLWPLSAPVEALVRYADRREWRTRRSDPRGSEMLLEFAKNGGPAEAHYPSVATARGEGDRGVTASTFVVASSND